MTNKEVYTRVEALMRELMDLLSVESQVIRPLKGRLSMSFSQRDAYARLDSLYYDMQHEIRNLRTVRDAVGALPATAACEGHYLEYIRSIGERIATFHERLEQATFLAKH
jgi:hypothetical protein